MVASKAAVCDWGQDDSWNLSASELPSVSRPEGGGRDVPPYRKNRFLTLEENSPEGIFLEEIQGFL